MDRNFLLGFLLGTALWLTMAKRTTLGAATRQYLIAAAIAVCSFAVTASALARIQVSVWEDCADPNHGGVNCLTWPGVDRLKACNTCCNNSCVGLPENPNCRECCAKEYDGIPGNECTYRP